MEKYFNINKDLISLAESVEEELIPVFKKFEKNELLCSSKVLSAFQRNQVSTTDFIEVCGYGYYDGGREKLEKIYSEIFNAEDALVRPQIMSGTHALALTLFGLLKYGDTLISITGDPYDSLQSIIGLCGDSKNSLLQNGVKYEQIELVNDDFDITAIQNRLKKGGVKVLEIQRSRGYSHRKSLTIDKIERVIKAIREIDNDVVIMVDNCYGDFVEDREPTDVGADVIVGSMLKNLGGGVAPTGGYIVGKKDLIWDISEKFSAPCVGKDLGANMNQLKSFYFGLYNAPSAVCSSLKTMAFASRILEKLGYKVDPLFDEKRTDIIQTIDFFKSDTLIKFCQGLQKASAVDSQFMPVPSEMPGYPHEEIMASGSFNPGSTIELSCDGPVVEPFTAYMQGGLTYNYGKLGVLLGINHFLEN
ncbi:MAG: methionine gamma-lyase family protein [Clostridia bacterium]|nr:methionine gamma-lyase family protein [Clostridia bacterium]